MLPYIFCNNLNLLSCLHSTSNIGFYLFCFDILYLQIYPLSGASRHGASGAFVCHSRKAIILNEIKTFVCGTLMELLQLGYLAKVEHTRLLPTDSYCVFLQKLVLTDIIVLLKFFLDNVI